MFETTIPLPTHAPISTTSDPVAAIAIMRRFGALLIAAARIGVLFVITTSACAIRAVTSSALVEANSTSSCGKAELPESDLVGQRAPVEKHDAGRTPAMLRIHVAYLSAVIAMALSTCQPRVANGGR